MEVNVLQEVINVSSSDRIKLDSFTEHFRQMGDKANILLGHIAAVAAIEDDDEFLAYLSSVDDLDLQTQTLVFRNAESPISMTYEDILKTVYDSSIGLPGDLTDDEFLQFIDSLTESAESCTTIAAVLESMPEQFEGVYDSAADIVARVEVKMGQLSTTASSVLSRVIPVVKSSSVSMVEKIKYLATYVGMAMDPQSYSGIGYPPSPMMDDLGISGQVSFWQSAWNFISDIGEAIGTAAHKCVNFLLGIFGTSVEKISDKIGEAHDVYTGTYDAYNEGDADNGSLIQCFSDYTTTIDMSEVRLSNNFKNRLRIDSYLVTESLFEVSYWWKTNDNKILRQYHWKPVMPWNFFVPWIDEESLRLLWSGGMPYEWFCRYFREMWNDATVPERQNILNNFKTMSNLHPHFDSDKGMYCAIKLSKMLYCLIEQYGPAIANLSAIPQIYAAEQVTMEEVYRPLFSLDISCDGQDPSNKEMALLLTSNTPASGTGIKVPSLGIGQDFLFMYYTIQVSSHLFSDSLFFDNDNVYIPYARTAVKYPSRFTVKTDSQLLSFWRTVEGFAVGVLATVSVLILVGRIRKALFIKQASLDFKLYDEDIGAQGNKELATGLYKQSRKLSIINRIASGISGAASTLLMSVKNGVESVVGFSRSVITRSVSGSTDIADPVMGEYNIKDVINLIK